MKTRYLRNDMEALIEEILLTEGDVVNMADWKARRDNLRAREKPSNDNDGKALERRINNYNDLIDHHNEREAYHSQKAELYEHMHDIADRIGSHHLKHIYDKIHKEHSDAADVNGRASWVLQHHLDPHKEIESFGHTGKDASDEAGYFSRKADQVEQTSTIHPMIKKFEHTHRRIMQMAKEHIAKNAAANAEKRTNAMDRKQIIEHHAVMERNHAKKQEHYMRMRKYAGQLKMFNLHRIYTKLANKHNRAANYHRDAAEMHIRNKPSRLEMQAEGKTKHQASAQADDITQRTLEHEKWQLNQLHDDPENQHPHRRIMQMASEAKPRGGGTIGESVLQEAGRPRKHFPPPPQEPPLEIFAAGRGRHHDIMKDKLEKAAQEHRNQGFLAMRRNDSDTERWHNFMHKTKNLAAAAHGMASDAAKQVLSHINAGKPVDPSDFRRKSNAAMAAHDRITDIENQTAPAGWK